MQTSDYESLEVKPNIYLKQKCRNKDIANKVKHSESFVFNAQVRKFKNTSELFVSYFTLLSTL